MSKRDDLISLVEQGETPESACEKLGVAKYVGFIWLKRCGLMEDPTRLMGIGSNRQMIGALGEAKFKELVPEALNVNCSDAFNHPDYDYEYNGLTIDVKTATVTASGRWHISHLKGGCDIYVIFLLYPQSEFYRVLLIPGGALLGKSVTASPANLEEKLGEWVVELKELKPTLDQITEWEGIGDE